MANNPYVNKVSFNDNVIIDLTSDTVTAGNLRSGYTAHSASGATITGTATSYVSSETLYVPNWMVTV